MSRSSASRRGHFPCLLAIAMIISPSLKTENGLLREVMREFGVQTKRAFADSRAIFQAFLAEQYRDNHTVVLMLDEAQGIRGRAASRADLKVALYYPSPRPRSRRGGPRGEAHE